MSSLLARSFSFDFTGPLPAVWQAMADTARYNEAAGLPRHNITETPQADGTIAFLARGRKGPFELEWEDLPCNWVRERWFEHRRLFRKGPLAELVARFEAAPAGTGCHGRYELRAAPAGLAGRLVMAGGFMRTGERMFLRLAAEADRFACGQRDRPFAVPAPSLSPEARARLATLTAELARSPFSHGLAERLAGLVAEAGEVEAARLRPLALARRWQVPPRLAVEAFLAATRLGLLELRWDLLCPRCRGAKAGSASLDRLPTGAHCGTCNIDYGRDFARNVELSFRPAASLRPLEAGEFCLLGPMSTPHIWAHVTLEPGEARTLAFAAPPGDYRLRTLEAGPEAHLRHDGAAFPAVTVESDGIEAGKPSPPGRIALRNRSPCRRTIVVEEREWLREVLTAERATMLQAFRDLFSDEVLRPGDEVAIRRVSLLFSDLKGSTALYEAVGDAAAYRLVREHFAYLAGIVREHDGCVVKTIGDAVMAAFHDPLQGLRAAIAMQERVSSFNAGQNAPIILKLGLHEGPCIAVTLNERLDYFGGAVNLTARLQGESRGGDVVVSREIAASPGAAALIERHRPQEESASLRGFAAAVPFLRLHVAGG